jgi:hypothetical protein
MGAVSRDGCEVHLTSLPPCSVAHRQCSSELRGHGGLDRRWSILAHCAAAAASGIAAHLRNNAAVRRTLTAPLQRLVNECDRERARTGAAARAQLPAELYTVPCRRHQVVRQGSLPPWAGKLPKFGRDWVVAHNLSNERSKVGESAGQC